jgi:serine/threonine-protein kinase HipA
LNTSKRAFDIEIDSLIISQKILNKQERFWSQFERRRGTSNAGYSKVGTSGGARPKAIIAYNEKTGQVKSGQTTAQKALSIGLIAGYGERQTVWWKYGLRKSRNELLPDGASGINMMECRLMEENGRAFYDQTIR